MNPHLLALVLLGQLYTLTAAEGQDPWPEAHVPKLRGIVDRCLAEKAWSGRLEVSAWPEWSGDVAKAVPRVSSDPMDGPTACIEAALAADPAFAAFEAMAGVVLDVPEDPAWAAAVQVEGGPEAAREAVRKRFGRCAAGRKVDAAYPIDVEVLEAYGYDAPVAQVSGFALAPSTADGREVLDCARRTYIEVPGLKKGGGAPAMVRVRTAPLALPKVDVEAAPDVPAAAASGISDLVSRCAAVSGWKGEVTVFVTVGRGSRSAGTMGDPPPDAMQQCLVESAPLGVPEGSFTAKARVR